MKPPCWGKCVPADRRVRARAYRVVWFVLMYDHWSGEQRDERDRWEVRKMGDGSQSMGSPVKHGVSPQM